MNYSGWTVVLGVSLAIASGSWADWSQFRGPGGNAVTEDAAPQTWSAEENLVWRAELPGLGTSSPIVVGDQVLVTCYSGYGQSAEMPGKQENLVRHVISVNRQDGRQQWQVTVPADTPESVYGGGNNGWHGYSSSTPVSDGTHVYVFFGRSGVFAFDLQGQQRWRSTVGTGVTGWGSGASPVLFGDLLIVNASVESRSLVALDKKDGQVKWRVEGIKGCWNTPALVQIPGGRTELIVSLPEKILALDPASGKELWHCEGIPDRGYVCPSVVAQDGIVYAIGGRRNTAMAVKAGGSGDVSSTHVLWTQNKGANVSSPVFLDGYLYWVNERQGDLTCLDGKTGQVMFQERIEPRPGILYASIVAAADRLYAVSQHEGIFVFAAKPQYTLIAQNKMVDDDHRANASLAVDKGRIYWRNDKFLYCLGRK